MLRSVSARSVARIHSALSPTTSPAMLAATGPPRSAAQIMTGSTAYTYDAWPTIVGTMVKINSGGSGGSAGSASPKDPAEAKVHEDITAAKATDYDKLFEDPIVTAGGKVGSTA